MVYKKPHIPADMRRIVQYASAFIGVMLAVTHRHVSPRMAKPYVWATSTGATVDADTHGYDYPCRSVRCVFPASTYVFL